MKKASRVARKTLSVLSAAAMLLTCGAVGTATGFVPQGLTVYAANENVATQLRVLDENGQDLGDNPIIYLDTSEAAGTDNNYHNITKSITVVASNSAGVAVNDRIRFFTDGNANDVVEIRCPEFGNERITAQLAGGHWEAGEEEPEWVGKNPGTAQLYFTTDSGEVFRTVTVVAYQPATDMTVSSGGRKLSVDNMSNSCTTMAIANHKYQFSAELIPPSSTDEVEWHVYDGSYDGSGDPVETRKAEITDAGLFTPKSNGMVTVVAKCKPTETTDRPWARGTKDVEVINENGERETTTLKDVENVPKYIHVIIVKENPAKALKILNAPESMELQQSVQLRYEATPTYTGAGYETGVTDQFMWVSSNPDVITVDDKGLITAVGRGEAKITLYGENQNVFSEVSLRVVTKASSISYRVKTISTRVGKTEQLTAVMDPVSADEEIEWISSNPSIATVTSLETGEFTNEQTAEITGVSKGVVTITARAKNSGAEANITCNVEEKIISSDVILTYEKNGKILKIADGATVAVYDQNRLDISGKLVSADGASPDDTIVWKIIGNGTDNSDYVEINEMTTTGLSVTGFAKGKITIIAKSKANPTVKKTFTLKVLKRATECSVYEEATGSADFAENINVGATVKLKAELRIDSNQPFAHDDRVASWTSSNPNAITVDENGVVTAVRNGSATITVTAASGISASVSFTAFTTSSVVIRGVNISSGGGLPFAEIALDNEMQGEYTLSADVKDQKDRTVSNPAIVWSSDNEAVAEVDSEGRVTAHQVGEATITVKSGAKTDKCIIRVTYPMNDSTVILDDVFYSPNTDDYKPSIIVMSGGENSGVHQILTEGQDYTLTFRNNKKVGDQATVTITGIGRYTGTYTYTFTINPKSLLSQDIEIAPVNAQALTINNYSYGVQPVLKIKHAGVLLVKDTDYTVSFSDNNLPGQAYATVTGVGNYAESVTVPFRIYCNHKTVQTSVDEEATCQHTGHEHVTCQLCGYQFERELPLAAHSFNPRDTVEPTYTRDGYTVYECSVCGTTEKRDYKPALSRINGSYCDITADSAAFVANGSVQVPRLSISYNQDTLTENTDYTLSYSNKNSKSAGDYTITVSFRGAYTGTATVNYSIVPAAVVLTMDQETVTLKAGESVLLKATTAPEKAAAALQWESSDSSVAVVAADGKLTAVAPGTVTVTAICGDLSETCEVTVKPAPFSNKSVLAEDHIKLGKAAEAYTIASGGTSPYQYAVYYKLSGADKWTTVQNYMISSTVSIKPSALGVYDVRIKAKDNAGKIASKDMTLYVEPNLKNNSRISDTTIMLGETARVVGVAAGGDAPYEYEVTYKKSTDTEWTTLKDYSTDRVAEFTPDAAGTYSLKVRVMDDNGTVVVKNLNLKVTKKLTSTAKLAAKSVTLGSKLTLTCAASGGEPDYQYKVEYRAFGTEEYMVLQDFAANATVEVTPEAASAYEFYVTVRDSKGRLAYQKLNAQVYRKLVNSSALSVSKITLGESVTVNAKASGGRGGYTYNVAYKSSKDTKWTTVQSYSVNNAVAFLPKTTRTLTVQVKVKDAGGVVASKELTLKVFKVVSNLSTISAEKVTVGKALTVTAKGSGGTGVFQYAVYYKKDSASAWTSVQKYDANATVTITPKEAASYKVLVKVKDSRSKLAEKEFSFYAVKTLTNKSALSADSIALGSKVTVQCNAVGGEDFYQYAVSYKKSDASLWTSLQGYSANNAVPFTPKAAASYEVMVKVKDKAGVIATKKLTLTVTA